jgi:hypothetical protein
MSDAPIGEISSYEATDQSHGRIDTRKIEVLAISSNRLKDYGSDFPHVHQIFKITRTSTDLRGNGMKLK